MHRSYGILLVAGLAAGLVACLAACSTTSRESQQAVRDHFDDNLGVLMRSFAHPCGADVDNDGDGKVDVHYTYTYDSLGRSQRDLGIDTAGAIYEQIDYTWDNAGHLVKERDAYPMSITTDLANTYDTLGRQTQYRADLFDSDSTDNTGTLNTTSTIHYSDFDDLGHSAHGDQTYEDHDLHTIQMLDREYGYDDLGRRISLDVHFTSGDRFQSWQHAYDDNAHTVSTTLDEPRTLRGSSGFTAMYLDTYDADGHWTASHDVTTDTGGGTTVDDVITRWDGDRELGTSAVFSGPGFTSKTSTTFKYSCPSARTAVGELATSTLPPPAHRRIRHPR